MRGPTTTIDTAIETFVGGFCFTRSLTHPFVSERVGPLWVMRDGPRRASDRRTEEWVSSGTDAAEVDRIVRKHAQGRYAICAILPAGEPDAQLREGFKRLKYRLRGTEPLMVHSLTKIPRCESPATVVRVTTPELAEKLGKASRTRPIPDVFMAPDSPMRQYFAEVDGEVVGYVRSISAGPRTWCSMMYVRPKHRRQGIARAMLARMLRDDRQLGSTAAVLLASHTGAKLYETVGYERIGTLYLYSPGKR